MYSRTKIIFKYGNAHTYFSPRNFEFIVPRENIYSDFLTTSTINNIAAYCARKLCKIEIENNFNFYCFIYLGCEIVSKKQRILIFRPKQGPPRTTYI